MLCNNIQCTSVLVYVVFQFYICLVITVVFIRFIRNLWSYYFFAFFVQQIFFSFRILSSLKNCKILSLFNKIWKISLKGNFYILMHSFFPSPTVITRKLCNMKTTLYQYLSVFLFCIKANSLTRHLGLFTLHNGCTSCSLYFLKS